MTRSSNFCMAEATGSGSPAEGGLEGFFETLPCKGEAGRSSSSSDKLGSYHHWFNRETAYIILRLSLRHSSGRVLKTNVALTGPTHRMGRFTIGVAHCNEVDT